jgi:predicted NUDIX family NTP pyrophosphohydrolase
MEWPPRSGKKQTFPEIDCGEWFDPPNAKLKILESQAVFIEELLLKIA